MPPLPSTPTRCCRCVKVDCRKPPHTTTRTTNQVYFGGGTPSLVPPHLISTILTTLRNTYGIDPNAEITLEADPGTFDAARLGAYMDVGITRFSVGVQAFDDTLLEACGRAHGLAEVEAALEALQVAGVANWSMDLISGAC